MIFIQLAKRTKAWLLECQKQKTKKKKEKEIDSIEDEIYFLAQICQNLNSWIWSSSFFRWFLLFLWSNLCPSLGRSSWLRELGNNEQSKSFLVLNKLNWQTAAFVRCSFVCSWRSSIFSMRFEWHTFFWSNKLNFVNHSFDVITIFHIFIFFCLPEHQTDAITLNVRHVAQPTLDWAKGLRCKSRVCLNFDRSVELNSSHDLSDR